MSTYTLNIARVGRGSGVSEGEHDMVNVLVDGHYQPGRAHASLALEGHDGHPGCCQVYIPLGVMIDGHLAQQYAEHLFRTADTGTRHYTFATRDAALTFLRRLYGLDAPQPASEPIDASELQDAVQEVPHAGFSLSFATPRTLEGCTVVDFTFDGPSYQEPVQIGGESTTMTVSGEDYGDIIGSDLLGWDIQFGKRLSPDLIEGIVVPGVTFRVTKSGRLAANDFASLEAAMAFVTYAYERLYEAFYLGFEPYTVATVPVQASDSPRSVPAPLARNVAPYPHPVPNDGATDRAAFSRSAAYPHPQPRNTP